jgi:drug/metabolite transporter (DMT)-like permease
MPRILPYLWMLAGSLAFAVMGTLAHALGSSCDWRIIALARTLLALVFATGLALGAGVRLVLWRPRTLWMRSLAGSASLVCTFFALTRLPVSDVLTLTNMFPVWVGLLSWPLLGQPPTARTWVAVACAVLGVVLIQQPHLAQGNFAVLIALVSSFTTAVAMIGLHRLEGIDYRAIVVHFSAVALVVCVASLFALERVAPPEDGLSGWAGVMLLGVGVTATIGQLFLTKAFSAGQPAKVSVVGLSQVVFALGFDVLLWQRSVDSTTLLGMSLVMAPTAWLMVQGV